MSILAVETPDDVPAVVDEISATQVYVLAGIVLGIAVAGYLLGLLRRRPLTLPDRIAPYHSAWPFFGVAAVGMFLWLGSQAAYGIYLAFKFGAATQPVALDESMFSPIDFAFLATVPFLVATTAVLIGNAMLGRDVLPRLGIGLKRLLPGVGWGVLAMVLVMPLMLLAATLTELFYRRVGYEHPTEHTLLRVMKESSSPVVQATIIVGATTLVPLFEELFFRGHVQTLLRRFCLFVGGHTPTEGISFDYAVPAEAVSGPEVLPPPPAPPPLPPLPPGQAAVVPALMGLSAPPIASVYDAADSPLPEPRIAYPAWPSWVAIIITSAAFALVHEIWSAPLIFLLSLCLGYAYERTNNIWIPITMHAVFNTVNTTWFLLS